ncbi:hypothetical protein DFQ30_002151 [Apophysomyces sp. BC1015]|nr:hypothetical protein DFQ30_002151 [Apophysomyces sp. BC1015]
MSERQAQELVQQAEKKLNGWSWFGNGNKQEEAAELYEKAGNNFKLAQRWPEAGETFLKSADLYKKVPDMRYEASKAFENAAKCLKKNDSRAAIHALQEAIDIDKDGANFRNAAKHHQEIAEIYESEIVDLQGAMENWEEASKLYMADDSQAMVNKCLLKVAHFAAQLELYESAIEKFETVAAASVDNQLTKWSLKEYLLKAGMCLLCSGNLFGFSTPVDIEVTFVDEDQRKHTEVKVEKDRRERYPIFLDGETVNGKINIRLRDGKKLEHNGIKVEFVGSIELFYDRGKSHEFLTLSQELAAPGELRQNTTFDYEFKKVEKQYECYNGINARLRYFVRVTIARRLADIVRERDIWVYSYRMPTEVNNSIKMEVGIEDCLHIEFEYNKSKYHLKDVIVGKIYFLLVRIKIKTMELSIIRRETTGASPNLYNESETITKFEIMDGAPVRGETIPIRLFLGGFDLAPTFRDVNKKFSTRYYLNLVLIDEENRRYFKQQEITMFRRKIDDGYPPDEE